MHKTVSIVLAFVLLLTHALAAMAHCLPNGTHVDFGPNYGMADGYDGSHASRAVLQETDHTHKAHVHIEAENPTEDSTLGNALGLCAMGFAAIDPLGSTLELTPKKELHVQLHEHNVLSVTLTQPTPPPNLAV